MRDPLPLAAETIEKPTSAAVLAAWLGVAERTIRGLADRGLVIRTARGQYSLQASVKTYLAHLRGIAANRSGDEKANLDLTAERARLAKEQADAQHMKNEIMRGEWLNAEEAVKDWGDTMVRVRLRTLRCVDEIAVEIPTLTRHQVQTIDRLLRAAMTAAAEE